MQVKTLLIMARVKRATIVRVALSPHHSLNARSLEDDVSRGRTVIYLLRIVLTSSRQVTGHLPSPEHSPLLQKLTITADIRLVVRVLVR